MVINTVEFKNHLYPAYQANGNAARFCLPFAKEVCTGYGYDIGYSKDEWKFPGAIGIDANSTIESCRDPYNLPIDNVDYVFSSHCLEHLDDWVKALDHWKSKLKPGGVLFLYLPDHSQVYWRPWHNRKHKHCFTPEIIWDYFEENGFKTRHQSAVDLNHSFITYGDI